jgi:outer membrane autotransporter protein
LQDRVGSTSSPAALGIGQSIWGRAFAQQVDNRYRAFSDPRASGELYGFQAGVDLWRGSLFQDFDVVGVYFSYGYTHANISGLVTNAAATAYVLQHTGTLNLNAWSGGGYWTHYGPTGWYFDAVVQGTGYTGFAKAEFTEPAPMTTNLPAHGSGVIGSLEAGDPIPMTLGARFVLVPEWQILWQYVSFKSANDGIQIVEPGSTSGATGRLGLLGQWTLSGDSGAVWQPYVLANVWQDWGGKSELAFAADTTQVPLSNEATRLEFAGGVNYTLARSWSFFAQAGYQFAVAPANVRRDGAEGIFGLQFTW